MVEPDEPFSQFALGLIHGNASVSWLGSQPLIASSIPSAAIADACSKALNGELVTVTGVEPRKYQLSAWPLAAGSGSDIRGVIAAFDLSEFRVSSEFRDGFCSLISHELKTPIAALRMHVDYLIRALSQGSVSEFRRTKLLEMAKTGLGMIDVFNELLENLVGHIEFFEGEVLLNRSNFDLSELVIDISTRMRTQFLAAGCTLGLSIRSRSPGYWDKAKIDQLIVCLLSNAIKYGVGKPIQIEIERDENNTRLSVIDQGIGVHPDDHDRIFKRFERASNVGGYSGIGLGLFIAKSIAEAHGASIKIQSDVNKGCRFDVLLPSAGAAIER